MRRTWSPRGRTPVLRHRFGWNKGSMAAALGDRPDVSGPGGGCHLQQPSDNTDPLIEFNEAFAAQVLAVTREWKLSPTDLDRVNVNGSGIALGRPVGPTGGRILATLAREMHRRQVRYGLETMCIGGGQGLPAVFERVD